jgi:acyl transferase domain-containing protein/acyl carrier protein
MTSDMNSQNPEALRRALVAIRDLRVKLSAVESAKTEPIAIIGMGCHFPGGANNPELYWQLLREGRDAISEVPPDRWDINQYYDPDPNAAGKTYNRWGGFLDQVDQFDPQFFGISPREALSLDPQQRMLLEVSWEALENAGIAPDTLAESQTGVFVGLSSNDYMTMIVNGGGYDNIDPYVGTGGMYSVAAGRVAFVLGLRGPTMTVDTACSSSLVTVHLACQSLRTREADLALAGGANLILSPMAQIYLSRLKAMSPTGRCRTFDAAADGFVRGEGCGMVVLKRLSDALSAGDNILAVVSGTAINHDGHSSGLTVPNGLSQQAVIRMALQDAGLHANQISYIETHGTGTPLGDPIEARALAAVMGEGRTNNQPLLIGSVKTNIGHLEPAAGIAAIMKVILALQHHEIPPHLHFQTPSPYIDWDQMPFKVTPGLTAWPVGETGRFAGINAFGFSGTNAHVIISEAPVAQKVEGDFHRPLNILTLSARNESALKQLAASYAQVLTSLEQTPEDIAYTANTGRAQFAHALSVVAENGPNFSKPLSAYVNGQLLPGTSSGQITSGKKPKVAFLFTGQGSQYVDMGRQLYETQPVFRAELDRCNEILQPFLGESLLTLLYPEDTNSQPSKIDHTAFTQPALFAIEYALARLWMSWGIEPTAVMGHSVGEYVAGCIAGIYSLEDGLKLIAGRGHLMGSLPSGGKMAAVFTSLDRVQTAIEEHQSSNQNSLLSIAAINGPDNVVISGDSAVVEEILEKLASEGIKSKALTVSHAFHSPLMDPILEDFEQLAGSIQISAPNLRLVSNITARLAGNEITQPSYWRKHIRQPVRFSESIATLLELGCTAFIEIGPNPTLLSMAQRCLPNGTAPRNDLLWLPSLRKGRSDWETLLTSLGELYTHGAEINWQGYEASSQRRKIPLPTYPFQRQRYWMEFPPVAAEKLEAPTLTGPIRIPNSPQIHFSLQASTLVPEYLSDHRIFGEVIFPASGYVELVLAAAHRLGSSACRITSFDILEALVITAGNPVTVQLVLTPLADDSNSTSLVFEILSASANDRNPMAASSPWKKHASGTLDLETITPTENEDLQNITTRLTLPLDVNAFNQRLEDIGLNYGPRFRGLHAAWLAGQPQTDNTVECLGEIRLPASLQTETADYRLHPGLLDACFQLIGAALLKMSADNSQGQASTNDKDEIYLPVHLNEFTFYQTPSFPLWCHVRTHVTANELPTTDLTLMNDSGSVIAELRGMQLQRATRAALQRLFRARYEQWFYEIAWRAVPVLPPQTKDVEIPDNPDPHQWLILGDNDDAAANLAEALHSLGAVCTVEKNLEASTMANIAENSWQGIVYLGALGANESDPFADQKELLGGVLNLTQRMAAWTQPPRLWLVTRGAQATNPTQTVNSTQSTLWGFGRSLALEFSDLWGGLVDLDPAETNVSDLGSEQWERLAGLFLNQNRDDIDHHENQLAIRSGKVMAARLVRHRASMGIPHPPVTYRGDGAYLITGGLGGLGLEMAQHLAARGAGFIVLAGRSPADETAKERIEAIRAEGAQVVTVQIDITRREQVASLLERFGSADDHHREFPTLYGIIHGAGVIDDGLIINQEWSRYERVLAPKISGAWNLHTLTLNQPLEFFILLSSSSALFGAPGQSNYASANAFLDALAHHRCALGLPAMSINWSAWSEVGMAARLAEKQGQLQGDPSKSFDRWRALGIQAIAPEEGLGAFEAVMQINPVQMAVAPIQWDIFSSNFVDTPIPSLLREVAARPAVRAVIASASEGREASSGQHEPSTQDEFTYQLQKTDPLHRQEIVLVNVQQQVATVLRLDPSQPVDLDTDLTRLGIDSLMAVELKNRIELHLGADLPVAQILNGPSVTELAALVLGILERDELDGETSTVAGPTQDQPLVEENASAVLQNLDQLSDDDVDRMLRSMTKSKDTP